LVDIDDPRYRPVLLDNAARQLLASNLERGAPTGHREASWQICPVADFGAYASEWHRLNEQLGSCVLLDPVFIKPLLDEFARGDEVLVIGDLSGRPAVMAILRRTSRWAWQTFQPANAPLGMALLAAGAHPGSKGFDALLASLPRALPGPALLVGLSQLDPEMIPRPAQAPRYAAIDYIATPRLTIAGSYAEFWSARGKNLRHNISRQRNRLARDAVETRLERLHERADMRQAVADYARLESAGWKDAIASAVREDDRQGRFYTGMLEALAGRGEALVLRLFYNEQLVATDLCLLRDRVLVILKTTYDETQKGTSPAHLMRHQIFAEAFERRDIRRVEFFGPVQDWHLRWTGEVRTLYHLNYYRARMIRQLHATLRRGD